MSRINSNISSLQAIHRLNRNNADLATRLQRLSSGLKINAGKGLRRGVGSPDMVDYDGEATRRVAAGTWQRHSDRGRGG